MSTTQTAKNQTATKPANGAKPETAPAAAQSPETATAEAEKRTRGATPTMPVGALWREAGGKVVAAVIHPNGTEYRETGKGIGSAKGAIEDSGFLFGDLHMDGPEWISARIPAGVELLGYAKIKSFPLPKNQ